MQSIPSANEELQEAVRYRNLQKLLRTSAIQSIPIGFIGIFIGIFNRNANIRDINSLVNMLIVVGVFCIIHGMICLLYPKSWLLFSELIVVGLVSITACISVILFFTRKTNPSIGPAVFVTCVGLSAYYAIRAKQVWRQYTSYRHVSKVSAPELIDWINTTANSIRKTKRNSDPLIIDFMMQSVWIAQLNPDSIIIVEKSGTEAFFLDHTRFSIARPIPNPFNKHFGDTVITLDSAQYKGRIRHKAYDAYLNWQQSLPQAPNMTWVPRA